MTLPRQLLHNDELRDHHDPKASFSVRFEKNRQSGPTDHERPPRTAARRADRAFSLRPNNEICVRIKVLTPFVRTY